MGVAPAPLAPRLFFEDATLWNTALKLKTLIESASSDNSSYVKALGAVLAHELVRLNGGLPRVEGPVRGGLAAWQQRTVIAYIEEHFAEQISLDALAKLVRLEPVLFLPSLQAIIRHAAPSLSRQPSHRARQDIVGETRVLGDGDRNDGRLLRDKLVLRCVSQGDRPHSDAHADDVLTPANPAPARSQRHRDGQPGQGDAAGALGLNPPHREGFDHFRPHCDRGHFSIGADASLPSCDPLAGGMELDTAFKQSKLNVQRERGSAAMR